MKKLQQLALLCAAIGIGFALLVYQQVDTSAPSYNQGGIGMLVMIISLPTLLASAVFNIPTTLLLLDPKRRTESGMDTPLGYAIWMMNWLLLFVYLYFIVLSIRVIFHV
ncbi:hypothetical protein [Aliidiomarina indica]|uniref:hypothetical protein n=1 Tax=Aliidiomarina indica TaxID=2749147 RepID=UPI00188EC19D|nr:hypothetical protein [Aliidiomarina indica]